MKSKVENFVERKFDDLVEKVGISRARLLLKGILVIFPLSIIAVL